jgi:hypothetical protein
MRASAIFYADFLLVSKFFLILLPLPPEPTQTLMYKGFEGGGREIFIFHFAST